MRTHDIRRGWRKGRRAIVLAGSLGLVVPLLAVTPAAAARPRVTAAALPNQIYHTTAPNVNERSGPGTNYRVVYTIGPKGHEVQLDCYRYGTSVNGDRVWYAEHGFGGWISGYYVDTGRDPVRYVDPC